MTNLGLRGWPCLASSFRRRARGSLGMMMVLVPAIAVLAACGSSEQSVGDRAESRSKQHVNRQAKSFALAREVCEETPKADFAVESVDLPADATDVAIARGYASQWGEKEQKAAFRGCLDGLSRAPARFPPSSPAAQALWDRSFIVTSIAANGESGDPPVAQSPHIRFWFSREGEHAVSWKARCNGYGGDIRVTTHRIKVSELGSTLIGCPEAPGKEDAWLARFMEAMPSWHLEGERLQLSTDYATLRLRG
jgi:heat shock protein HslJ